MKVQKYKVQYYLFKKRVGHRIGHEVGYRVGHGRAVGLGQHFNDTCPFNEKNFVKINNRTSTKQNIYFEFAN